MNRFTRYAVRMMIGALLFGTVDRAAAVPIVTFYTDRTTFNNALVSSTLIDFEGIVTNQTAPGQNGGNYGTPEDGTSNTLRTSTVIDGVTFSFGDTPGTTNGAVASESFFHTPSALLFSNDGFHALTADLTSAGSGFTAVGGFFGNIMLDITVGGVQTLYPTTLTLVGTTGVLDIQNLDAYYMGCVTVTCGPGYGPTSNNFFGWTVQGDTIVSIKHDLDAQYAPGLDDFVYGNFEAIPEPSTMLLLGSGLIVLGAWRKKK